MSFETYVQQYVSLDNQMKALTERMKTLREAKNSLTEKLTTYATNNNLLTTTVNITDGKLRFVETKVQPSLTFKYVERILGEIITNKSQVDQIMNHLKEKREVKYIKDIKRISNI